MSNDFPNAIDRAIAHSLVFVADAESIEVLLHRSFDGQWTAEIAAVDGKGRSSTLNAPVVNAGGNFDPLLGTAGDPVAAMLVLQGVCARYFPK